MRTRTLFAAVLAGCALLVFSASAHAQTAIGVRGGVSVASASLDVNQTFDTSNRNGFVGGIFMDFGGSSMLGLQIGAQYTQKGVNLDFGTVTDQLDLGYLEIPAVVKLGLPLGMIKPSVFGGVGLGFNTTCEGDINGTAACDAFSSTEYSGIFGADVALYLGGISLWADGRYHVGLNDISGDLEFANDLKNRVWAFQAGIGIVLGR